MSYSETIFQDGVVHELKRIAAATEKIADALEKQNAGNESKIVITGIDINLQKWIQ